MRIKPLSSHKRVKLSIVDSASCGLEGVEGLVCVTNERQAHLCVLLRSDSFSMSTMHSAVVFLGYLIDREVGDINVA